MANEVRLIDANELLEKHTCDVYGAYDDSCMLKAVFVPYIKGAPTVDAVEVVRCKDCKYWNKRYETKGLCMNHGNAVLCFTKPDFYCACGERDNDGICKKG